MQEAEQYDAIRRRVEQRFQQRNAFYTHLAVYTLVSMLLWFVYGFTANQWQLLRYPIIGILLSLPLILNLPWPLVIMAMWGIVLLAHGIEDTIRRRIAIQREIEHELVIALTYEKPKNDSYVHLTHDGELDVMEDEADWKKKRKNDTRMRLTDDGELDVIEDEAGWRMKRKRR